MQAQQLRARSRKREGKTMKKEGQQDKKKRL